MNRTPPGLLTQLTGSIRGRQQQTVKPIVLTLDELNDSGEAAAIVPPRGTIVIYFAAQNDATVDSITTALSARDSVQLQSLGREALQRFRTAPRLPEDQVVNALTSVECLFTVSYAGRTVVEHIGLLPGQTFGTRTLAYIGSPTNDADFQITEFRASTNTPSYKYLIAKRAPVLTELERSVLNRLPVERQGLTVGGLLAADTFQEVADVVKNMVNDAERQKEGKKGIRFDLLDEISNQLQAGTLDPTATVQALMNAREQLVLRSMQ